MWTKIEISKEGFEAIKRYRESSSVYFFRFDCVEAEEESIVCNETSFMLKNATYEEMVSVLISFKYTIDAQLALLYNYQMDNEKYKEEMENYQTWRSYCKNCAQTFFNENVI